MSDLTYLLWPLSSSWVWPLFDLIYVTLTPPVDDLLGHRKLLSIRRPHSLVCDSVFLLLRDDFHQFFWKIEKTWLIFLNTTCLASQCDIFIVIHSIGSTIFFLRSIKFKDNLLPLMDDLDYDAFHSVTLTPMTLISWPWPRWPACNDRFLISLFFNSLCFFIHTLQILYIYFAWSIINLP